jgi:hypothetical protein
LNSVYNFEFEANMDALNSACELVPRTLQALARVAIFGLMVLLPTAASAEQVVRIKFTDTIEFDRALSSALSDEVHAISVSVSPPSDNKIPPRLKSWIDRLLKERGEVRWRDDGGRGAVAVVMGVVLSFLAELAIEYVSEALSDPVKNYHAVISFKNSRNATQVLAIEFYRKDSSAWIEAVTTSNATR